MMEINVSTESMLSILIEVNSSVDNETSGDMLPNTWHYVIAVILTVFGVFGFIENILVLILFSKVKSLQSQTNMFVCSIAVSDFLMCLLANPFVIASSIAHIWIFGDSGCIFYGFLVYFLGMTSMYNLMILAVDRYIVITKPVLAAKLTSKIAGVMIGSCWALGLLWAVFPLLGWNSYGLEAANTSCSVVWDSKDPLRFSYNITIFFTCLVIPVSVMVYSYVQIYITVRNVGRKGIWRAESRIAKKNLRVEKKLAKSICVMIGAFLISWIPYAIVSFWTVFGDTHSLPPLAKTMPAILAKCSSVWNPIIYVSTNRQFRKEFFAMFSCCKLEHYIIANEDIGKVSTIESSHNSRTQILEMKTKINTEDTRVLIKEVKDLSSVPAANPTSLAEIHRSQDKNNDLKNISVESSPLQTISEQNYPKENGSPQKIIFHKEKQALIDVAETPDISPAAT